MRHLLQSIFIILLLSCNRQDSQPRGLAVTDTIRQDQGNIDRSKYYVTLDTLVISDEAGDTLRFSKEDFNQIVDKHPELYQEFISNPDYLYHCYGEGTDFGSEVGQDTYFALYAYFLKQRNGVEKYSIQRANLIQIYQKINLLFSFFQYGGTYFGHQQKRIVGYAEYSVYLYSKGGTFEEIYDIRRQKELYISSLQQLIKDESSIDMNSVGIAKDERVKELNTIVKDLDQLIKDIFYLRRAQAFQHENYEYY